ncbi:MAG: hypothetical protein MRJ93_11210 [Nitrososphaeraceae archaeon]|nr:hypothetical protein [Nitrososphaeraceae archaeon]
MEKKFKILIYTTALTTLIAGILHILKVPNAIDGNINAGILFLVGGIAQIFWIVPIIKQWGKVWYSIGIAGTVIFVLIWVITRIPDNPITGRGGSISNEGITIQVFQIAFIILSILILFKITKIKR